MIKTERLRYWDVAAVTTESLLSEMDAWRRDRQAVRTVCFCDANGLAHGWRDPELQAAYRNATVVCADGVVVERLVRVCGATLPARCIGPVTFEQAMAYGVSRGWRHFLYGTKADTLARLKAKMEAKYPGVKIVGTYAPEYAPDPSLPQNVDCDFFWVALGSPKQEMWSARHLKELNAVAVLSVGAAFDFLTGSQRPVPKWVHDGGVCWLWRIFTGGWRVLKRDLWCVPRAACILISEYFRVRVFKRPV